MKKEFIVFKKESLVESVIADLVTFAFLILCIWFSHDQGGGWWTFFTCSLFILAVLALATRATAERTWILKTKQEALEWAESLPDDLKG